MQQFHFWVYSQNNQKQGLRYLYTNVHSSIFHNNQKLKTTQMFIDRRMDKQNVAYTYNGLLFSLKKEVPLHAITWMNIEDIMLSKISLTQKDKYYMIPLT